MSDATIRKRSEVRGSRPRLVNRLQRAWGESVFYQVQLRGPAPDRFFHTPRDPRTPDEAVARMLARGRLSVGAESVDCEGELDRLWDLVKGPGPLHSFLHEFSWLRHAAALGDAGAGPTRALIEAWLDRYEKWSPEAWTPYLAAERLTQLCCAGPFVLKTGDALWRSRVLTSMARQTRHLANSSHRAGGAFERLMTAMGLTIAGLCLPGCETPTERGLELLRRELRLQIRPDGGHVSRNPSRQLSVMIRLQMVAEAMAARRFPPPAFLRNVAARAGAHLHLFRCGDGGLAVFNGGYEDDRKALVAALHGVDLDASPSGFARHSGFQRLEAGRLTLIADTGAARRASGEAGGGSRATSLASFHFSSGRARIVVNCGSGAHLSREWARALRLAPAHSCLSSDLDSPEAEVLSGGEAWHKRGEDGRGQLLEIERTADAPTGRLRYVRKFFVGARGDDLRGHERLTGVSAAFMESLALRFHLHPSVKASLARDGKSVVLATGAHEGWRFRTNCRGLHLEKSVYCGEGGAPVSTEQIIVRPVGLRPARDGDMVMKWGFRRVDAA